MHAHCLGRVRQHATGRPTVIVPCPTQRALGGIVLYSCTFLVCCRVLTLQKKYSLPIVHHETQKSNMTISSKAATRHK